MAQNFTREVHPFPGKVKSSVWEFFGFYKDDGGVLDKSKAICRLCRRAISYTGNTTNLRAHVVHHHKDEDSWDDRTISKVSPISPAAFVLSTGQNMLPPSLPSGSVTNVTPSELRSVENCLRTFGDDGEMGIAVERSSDRDRLFQPDVLNSAILDVLISDLIPVETLESPTFKNLFRVCNRLIEIPSSEQLNVMLQQQYSYSKKKVRGFLSASQSEYLKVEIWNNVEANFMTVSVQVLMDNWKVYSYVLKTWKLSENVTGEGLADMLQKTIQEWDLPENIVVISGNKPEIVEAIGILHCLNVKSLCVSVDLAASVSLNEPIMQNVVKHARCIVQLFSRISVQNILQEKQTLLQLPKKNLVMDNAKSWVSTLEMLEVLQEENFAISATFNDPLMDMRDRIVKMFSEDEWSLLQSLISILKPLKKAVCLIKDMKHSTMSVMLPVLKKLEMALSKNDLDSQVVADVKEKMLNSLLLPYKVNDCRELLLISSLLDPRYKDLKFVEQTDQELAYDLLKLAAENITKLDKSSEEAVVDNVGDCIIKIEPSSDLEFSSSSSDGASFNQYSESASPLEGVDKCGASPAKRKKRSVVLSRSFSSDPMNDWLADVVQEVVQSEQEDDEVSNEISRFKSEVQILSTSSPLSWWKDRRKTYPILSELAKRYMSAPATLTYRDEHADRIHQRQRTSLATDNVEMMMFLNTNFYYTR